MSLRFLEPRRSDAELASRCREHLEAAVRIDSQSDEASPRIPSTPGQEELAGLVADRLRAAGATVARDEHANVVASLPGRHEGRDAPPLALMVHLDTSRGTAPLERLELRKAWDGSPLPFAERPDLSVGLETYPQVGPFVGQDVLHGPGRAPFGLDDKLGLAQMLTLADTLAEDERLPAPPLVLVARPDEEIGRMAAVAGLAGELAGRGVRSGFTLDGILPFEINVENFNAAVAGVEFASRPPGGLPGPAGTRLARVRLGGVNTHGATAKAEGHRAATRLAAEVVRRLEELGALPDNVVPVRVASDPVRDCDAEVWFVVGGPDGEAACRAWGQLERALAEVVAPHVPRGASWSVSDPLPRDACEAEPDGAALDALRFVGALLADRPGFVLAAEDSSGREGYSAPYRAVPTEKGVRVDVRLRDFEKDGLARRIDHVRALAREAGAEARVVSQYVNMGPHLSAHPHLVEWPRRAAALAGVASRVEPIRGGTGVDPFLERGVAIANLGTGYFAPESEKELTSLQMMARHVRWLTALLQVSARAAPRRAATPGAPV